MFEPPPKTLFVKIKICFTDWSRVWTTGAFNSENVYYETAVYTAAKKHLWYTGWVTLCGYPGDGKTCTAEHLVCNFVRGPWQYPQKRESWSSLEPRNDVWERKRLVNSGLMSHQYMFIGHNQMGSWFKTSSERPEDVVSAQGLHCLLTGFSIKNRIKAT